MVEHLSNSHGVGNSVRARGGSLKILWDETPRILAASNRAHEGEHGPVSHLLRHAFPHPGSRRAAALHCRERAPARADPQGRRAGERRARGWRLRVDGRYGQARRQPAHSRLALHRRQAGRRRRLPGAARPVRAGHRQCLRDRPGRHCAGHARPGLRAPPGRQQLSHHPLRRRLVRLRQVRSSHSAQVLGPEARQDARRHQRPRRG